jgi:hypothetical protein
MKKSLLATVAAAALFATTGMAAAEGGRDHGGAGMSQGGGAGMNSGAGMSRGAEKSGTELRGKSETTGAAANGSAEPRAEGRDAASGPSPDSNEVKKDIAPKSGSKANVDKAKPSTTGQGMEKSAPGAKSGAMGKDEPAAKSGANDKSAPASKSSMDEKSGAAGSKSSAQNQSDGSAGGSVLLNAEQKTKIRTTVLRSGSAPKVSRSSINFNIRVGTVVPRSVHFVAVPETLVEIHPAWRGYRYFVVDEEIIIVEPSSFKIVAVLTV